MGGARLRSVPIALYCLGCGSTYSYSKAGQLPKLCGDCSTYLRRCTKCRLVKPHEAFFKSHGNQTQCRECHSRKRPHYCESCGLCFVAGLAGRKDAPSLCPRCSQRIGKCTKCRRLLAVDQFAPAKDKASGRASHCRSCVRDRVNSEESKRHRVASKYGITVDEWAAMAQAQGGRCSICNEIPGPKGLVVDHDHETGAVRALLCTHCNIGIGHFKDDPERMRRAIGYLESFDSASVGGRAGD